jgi:hypothetical protein
MLTNSSRERFRLHPDGRKPRAPRGARGPQATIERAEKLASSCQRDKEYSKAALGLGSAKQFKRALAIADRVSDLKQRDRVLQFLSHEMAVSARDAGEWTDARQS